MSSIRTYKLSKAKKEIEIEQMVEKEVNFYKLAKTHFRVQNTNAQTLTLNISERNRAITIIG